MITTATIGTPVRFRENFGEVGADRIEFTINSAPVRDAKAGRLFVSLKYVNRVPGCGKTRLGYLDDLIDA
jgi:hypothetical protein